MCLKNQLFIQMAIDFIISEKFKLTFISNAINFMFILLFYRVDFHRRENLCP